MAPRFGFLRRSRRRPSAHVERRAEADETAVRVIVIHVALPDTSVELVAGMERYSVKIVAEWPGVGSQVSAEARTDFSSCGENAVWVRYDDHGCAAVVGAASCTPSCTTTG